MKKIIVTILLVAGCLTITMAQKPNNKNAKDGENRKEKKMEEITLLLSLTTVQQTQIKPILDEERKAMKDNREKYKGNQKCMRQAAFQTRAASESKIMAVLNPEQQKKFTEEKNKRKENRKKEWQDKMNKPIDCK